MTHKRILNQSLSTLAEACADEETAALAEETLGYCLAQLRELRDRARRRLGLASLWASFSDAWLFLAPDGTIMDCNAGLANAVGLPTEDLIGRPVWELTPPERIASRRATLASVLELGRPLAFETGGSVDGWAEVYLHPLGPPGRAWGVLVLIRRVGAGGTGCLRRTWLLTARETGGEPEPGAEREQTRPLNPHIVGGGAK